jgi:hypothetical protein
MLVYRNTQGGQVKLLRKALGRGRRLRTGSYSDRAVLDAIADADVVHFGIDRDEPVLTTEMLQGARDFTERPLIVVDFNTSGSTSGLEQIPGITLITAEMLDTEVEAFADSLCASEEFPRYVQEAETWIERQAPEAVAPDLALPCQNNGDKIAPKCDRCGRSVSPLASGSECA